MAASTIVSAADVARILNRFGASGGDMTDDLSDVILDYFDDRVHPDRGDDSDTETGEDCEERVASAVVWKASGTPPDQQLVKQDVSYSAPVVRIQTTESELATLIDEDQDSKLNALFNKGCGCLRDCVRKFPKELVEQSVLDCMENDSYCTEHVSHQHLIFLGAMNALVHNQPETIQKAHKSQARQQSRSTYMFRGVEVCRTFFSVVFGCGEKRLKNVKKQFLCEGINPKQHGNVHRAASRANFEKRLNARNFIQNFAENNALVLPGRLPNYKNPDLKLLPSSMSKKHVFWLIRKCNEKGWSGTFELVPVLKGLV